MKFYNVFCPLKVIPFLSLLCDEERENTQRQHDTLVVLWDSVLVLIVQYPK